MSIAPRKAWVTSHGAAHKEGCRELARLKYPPTAVLIDPNDWPDNVWVPSCRCADWLETVSVWTKAWRIVEADDE